MSHHYMGHGDDGMVFSRVALRKQVYLSTNVIKYLYSLCGISRPMTSKVSNCHG